MKKTKFESLLIKIIFVLPISTYLITMVAYPLFYNIRLSFYEWSMSSVSDPKLVGMGNYTTLMGEERFLEAVGRSLYFTGVALTVEVVLGVAIALLLNREFKGKNLVKTLFLLPMVTTSVAVGMIFLLIFEPTIGIANQFLSVFGIAGIKWLASPQTALETLMLVDIWQWAPLITLIVTAGLSSIGPEAYESAKVDGANRWQVVMKITLPMLKPTILMAAMLRLMDILKTFDIIYTMTSGGPGTSTETFNLFGFKQAFEYFNFGKAAAVLVLFMLLIMGISLLFFYIKKKLEVDNA